MKGMLLKEYYILKAMAKSYLAVLVVFGGLALAGVYDYSLFGAMFTMVLIMMPISGFAYDEQAGWDKFAAATPAGRRGVVRAKYVFVLLLAAVGMAISTIFYAAVSVLDPEMPFSQGMLSAVAVLDVGLFMVSVLLPLVFKLGSQKSRIALMLVVGVTVAVFVVAMSIAGGMTGLIALVGIILPLLTAGALLISYFTSCKIFSRKEL